MKLTSLPTEDFGSCRVLWVSNRWERGVITCILGLKSYSKSQKEESEWILKDSDEDKSKTSGKKLVLRGDGYWRLIGIFSRGGKEISDSDISKWVSKQNTLEM